LIDDAKKGAEVVRGIYQDQDGTFYEVIIPSATPDDLEAVVVYRELSGDYDYFVAMPENFIQLDAESEPHFALVKRL
jgi:hypothetical protein